MDTTMLVMLILCVIYIPIWVWVWRCPEKAEKYHLVKYGPCVMIKTHLGIKTMDRLKKYRRLWSVFGFVSKLISAILFFLMMYMLIIAVIALPSKIGSGGIGIQYALAIPGFNPILPLTYGIVALFVAMIVHEMGHGIQSRANDCKVNSTGLLYGVVPLGAFCEPDEEDLKKASRKAQMDVYSAGISVNTFVAVISIVLMILICSTVSVADFGQGEDNGDVPGVYSIDEYSPAYDLGIPTSALVLGIKEAGSTEYYPVEAVYNAKTVAFTADIEITPTKYYCLEYMTETGKCESSAMQMGAMIKQVTNNSPASEAGLEPLTFLYSITITSGDSEPVEYMISNSYDFMDMMTYTLPGDRAVVTTVTYSADGDYITEVHEQVVLTSSGSQGYLGISVTNSGMTLTTPTIMMDKATNPFYGCTTPISYVQGLFSYLSGPFNGLDPISSSITWWYDAPAGDSTWVIVKMLYWLFWLDILLAISNALPAYPFDGGFLFEGGINWLLEKFGMRDSEKREKASRSISDSVSTVVLIMFAFVLISFII